MYEKYINIINKNNGVITAKEAENKGISRMHLKKMTDEGVIERIEYGVYATDEFLYDEYYLLLEWVGLVSKSEKRECIG